MVEVPTLQPLSLGLGCGIKRTLRAPPDEGRLTAATLGLVAGAAYRPSAASGTRPLSSGRQAAASKAASSLAEAERRAAREQRRLELERELCVKFGLGSGPQQEAIRSVAAAAAPVHSAGPSRPPKPKPHRSALVAEEAKLPSIGDSSPAALAEGVLSVRRWKSALTPLWPDRLPSELPSSPAASPRRALSKTAPAEMAAMVQQQALDFTSTSADGLDLSVETDLVSPRKTMPEVESSHAEELTHSSERMPVQQQLQQAEQEPEAAETAEAAEAAAADAGGCGAGQVSPSGSAGQVSPSTAAATIAVLADALSETDAARSAQAAAAESRARLLAESSRRLRENSERLRLENRRARVFGSSAGSNSVEDAVTASADRAGYQDAAKAALGSLAPALAPETSKHLEDMRRKIVALDNQQQMERKHLEDQRREVEERRRAQEEFERKLQEQVENDLRQHRELEAREASEQALREQEAQQALAERTQRWKEQLAQEEQRSRQLEEQRVEGRAEAAQIRWQQVEEELERQWAEQEAEERRRIDEYASHRHRQFQEWERRLTAERQRFASEAEFVAAAKLSKVRNAARADEQFYGDRGIPAVAYSSSQGARPHPQRSTQGAQRPGSPQSKEVYADSKLSPDERSVLKELQSVQGASRDLQKAKVKDLLFRWHPDKNPDCPEKAKLLFQFVQQQRQLVLGL